ncbi:MAG: hypothetical protein ABI615_06850 [Chthoniobacterales bacterium]
MKGIRVIALVFGILLAIPAVALAEATYWSFNDRNLIPEFGNGELTVITGTIGTISEDWGAGTAVGSVNSTPAGRSLDFEYLIAAVDIVDLDISHLDFTGQTNVTLSFAVRSDELFQLSEYLTVSYDIGGGFTGTQILATPTSDWSLRTVNFGGVLDGRADAVIRIETFATLDVGHHLEFDNIYAVPEPTSVAYMALGGFFLLVFFRKAPCKNLTV